MMTHPSTFGNHCALTGIHTASLDPWCCHGKSRIQRVHHYYPLQVDKHHMLRQDVILQQLLVATDLQIVMDPVNLEKVLVGSLDAIARARSW